VLSFFVASTVVGVTARRACAAPTEEGDASEAEAPKDEGDTEAEAGGSAKASVSTASGTESSAKAKRSKRNEASSTRGSKLDERAAMKGRVGFGAMRTVAGLNALFLRGYVTDRLTLGLNLGVATFSHRDVDEDGEFGRVRTVGAVGVGPELFFWPVQGDRTQQVHADFGIGMRATTYVGFLGRLARDRGDTLDIPLEVDIEIPAAIQLFIGRRVAILPEFGVVFRVVPGNREPDQNGAADQNPGRRIGSRLGTTDGPGLGFELGDHAGFFMGIGVGYFFGKLDRN
jgi:hypothetical protein